MSTSTMSLEANAEGRDGDERYSRIPIYQEHVKREEAQLRWQPPHFVVSQVELLERRGEGREEREDVGDLVPSARAEYQGAQWERCEAGGAPLGAREHGHPEVRQPGDRGEGTVEEALGHVGEPAVDTQTLEFVTSLEDGQKCLDGAIA